MDAFTGIDSKTVPEVTLTGAALETLALINNPGYNYLLYEYDVTVQALTDFDVLGSGLPASAEHDYTIDWTVDAPAGGRIVEYTSTGASENLAVTPAAGNGMFLMEIRNLREITVKATGVNGAKVNGRYTLHN